MPKKKLPTTSEHLRVGDLQVDRSYQRDLNKTRARRDIGAVWDDDKAGTLEVSRRMNGDYYNIDGQHRAFIALELFGEDKKLPCKVHHGLTVAEEASIYHATNAFRVKMRPADDFKAALVAGLPRESAVNGVLKDLDLHVSTVAGPNTVGAVTAILRIHDLIGEDGLYDVLNILIAAWGRDATTYDADLMQAVSRLLHEKPDIDFDVLIKVLSKQGRRILTVDDWKRQGHSMKKAGGSTSRGFAIAQLISWAYDKKFERQPDKKINLKP